MPEIRWAKAIPRLALKRFLSILKGMCSSTSISSPSDLDIDHALLLNIDTASNINKLKNQY